MFTPKKWMIEVVTDWGDVHVPEGADLTNPEVFYSVYANSIDPTKYVGVSHAEYLEFVNSFTSWIVDPSSHDGIKFALYLFKNCFNY